MRISELLLNESEILDEITRPTHRAAAKILADAGYKLLGSGLYANVYAKPDDNYVLKLFSNDDEAYINFMYLTIGNPNPHFPKFKGKMMRVTDDYYAIRMERLTPLKINTDDSRKLARNLSTYTKLIQQKAGRRQPDNEKIIAINEYMDELDEEQPGIKYACNIIGNNLKTETVDIHDENIMMRGNVLVITDPVI